MTDQVIVVLEPQGPGVWSLERAWRIAGRLGGRTAVDLTESGPVFTLSGEYGLIKPLLTELCDKGIAPGPGQTVKLKSSHSYGSVDAVLIIKRCTILPTSNTPSVSTSASSPSGSDELLKALDVAAKLATLTMQSFDS